MANEKKNDAKKPETKVETTATATPGTTTVVPASEAPVVTETALAKPAKAKPVALTLGAKLALKDPAELEEACAEALGKLRALGTDSSLPAEIQKAVLGLVDQAAQVKPGMEEVTTRWRIPRIQIAQATSTTAAKPEAAKNGDLFTTAGKTLEKPFALIPIHFSYENIMFPVGSKAPSCQAPDAKLGQPYGECLKCPHLPFGMQSGGKGEQKKTDCQNQVVAIVAAVDLSQIYMVQFSKTSRGAGSALSTLASQQTAPWVQSYLLETEKGSSDLGNFHKYKISPTGKNNDEPKQKVAEVLCALYTAERHRFLADWYRGAASAPAMAAAAEGEFQGGKLDAGLAGTAEAESYELGETPPPATSVRSAAKPM